MAASLEDMPSVELMAELLQRYKCSSKPDKRIILIGVTFAGYALLLFSEENGYNVLCKHRAFAADPCTPKLADRGCDAGIHDAAILENYDGFLPVFYPIREQIIEWR